jgi:hypothetical protein
MSKLDDIRKIFEGYGKKLLEQKKQMIEKIHVWRNKCFRAIDEHVAEEKKHLDEEYERQKDLLEQQRQQFTKEASYQERKRDEEHIRHLVDQCMDLKFQLAAFKNIKREVEFIQLMAEDQQTQTNQNKRSANDTENKPIKDNGNITMASLDVISSLSSQLKSSNIKQIKWVFNTYLSIVI